MLHHIQIKSEILVKNRENNLSLKTLIMWAPELTHEGIYALFSYNIVPHVKVGS